MTGRRAALMAAVVLGVAALAEVLVTAGRASALPALAMTAPVALVASRPGWATFLAASAGAATVLSGSRPTIAGLLVVVGAGAVTAARRVQRLRAAAAARGVSERRLSETLLENRTRGERARIARELHDVVAHHISLIALQADTVRLTTAGLPADGAAGLSEIGATARTALTEMRRLLGVLRMDAEDEPERAPQPGLEQLNELVDTARAAGGGSARLIVRGAVRPLSPGLELAAYRIVQEALSNARRHAPGAGIDVDVRYDAETLHVRVRDNGPAAGAGTAGHGLTGMRERAAMIGGQVSTGPAYPCGFLVEAVLPVGGEPA